MIIRLATCSKLQPETNLGSTIGGANLRGAANLLPGLIFAESCTKMKKWDCNNNDDKL